MSCLTNDAQIACTTEGTLYVWGRNDEGQLDFADNKDVSELVHRDSCAAGRVAAAAAAHPDESAGSIVLRLVGYCHLRKGSALLATRRFLRNRNPPHSALPPTMFTSAMLTPSKVVSTQQVRHTPLPPSPCSYGYLLGRRLLLSSVVLHASLQ